jgi:hypothetical protein
MAGVGAALVILICTGCAQSTQTPSSLPTGVRPTPQEQCVQAVFTVLSGMVSRPYDNRPFEDFVTRYGTGSVTYSAYLTAFTPFYDVAATQGIGGAEKRLRPTIERACAGAH